MKKRAITIALILVCFLIFSGMISICLAVDSWTSKPPMSEGRSGLGVVALNGKIYAIGGATSNGFCTFNEEYDTTTGTWASKTSMPTARSSFAIASFQNKIYCIGGYALSNNHGLAINVNEVYNPTTDSWSTKAPILTAELNVRANVVEDKIYVIGGNNNGTLNQVYDPLTDSWTTKAPIPTAVSSYASAVAEGKIYVFTNNLTQIYNPANDSWSHGAPAPLPIILANAGTTTGVYAPERIYVFGVNAQLPYWQLTTTGFITQSYDPNTNSWETSSSMQTGRYDVGIATVNDLIYLIGGYTTQLDSSTFDLNKALIYTYSTVNEQYTSLSYSTTPLPITVNLPENTSYKPESLKPESFINSSEIAYVSIIAIVIGVSAGLLLYRRHRKTINSSK